MEVHEEVCVQFMAGSDLCGCHSAADSYRSASILLGVYLFSLVWRRECAETISTHPVQVSPKTKFDDEKIVDRIRIACTNHVYL